LKKKEVTALIIATFVLVAALVAGYYLIFPSKPKQNNLEPKEDKNSVIEVPENIDEPTYKIISNLEDYGKPGLDNIGKKDLFAGF